MKEGYTNVNWMRVGVKGWLKAFYAIETESPVFMKLMDQNQSNPATWVIDKGQFQSLKNPTFLDMRSAAQFEQGHVDGAINIPYADLWTFDNLEKLNKSKDIVIIYDDPVVAGAFAMTLRVLEYTAFILK
ncbi:MAG: rhodanese-like domain-containing protein [Syntrophobacteraceae bacterium]